MSDGDDATGEEEGDTTEERGGDATGGERDDAMGKERDDAMGEEGGDATRAGDTTGAGNGATDLGENVSDQFDRLPETDADREVAGRASREAVLDFWADRFGIPRSIFADYTFWEKGAGKIWAFRADAPAPLRDVESIGMCVLRTRQEHWKPTTDGVQRFGGHATECVIDLTRERAERFVAGEDQDLPAWDGDWGYLIARHEVAGEPEPLGVGLYVYDELRSMVPKGRRREF